MLGVVGDWLRPADCAVLLAGWVAAADPKGVSPKRIGGPNAAARPAAREARP